MEYMEQQMQTAMAAAEADYRRDATFRRYVDMAVHEAMRHPRHYESEVDERDLHHIAVTAAMATLRLAIENDGMLAQVTAERDAYKKQALGLSMLSPQPFLMRDAQRIEARSDETPQAAQP